MEKRELHDLVYKLGSKSGTPLKAQDSLIIIVDGKETKNTLQDLFFGYKQESGSVRGYSILQSCEIVHNSEQQFYYLMAGAKKVYFKNSTTGELIGIKSIEKPLIQWNDKDITEEEITTFKQIIDQFRKTPTVEKKPEVEEPKKEEPKAEEPKKEEPKPEVKEEAPIDIEATAEYQAEKSALVDQGYSETSLDNLRIFTHTELRPYIIRISEGGFGAIALIEHEGEWRFGNNGEGKVLVIEEKGPIIKDRVEKQTEEKESVA